MDSLICTHSPSLTSGHIVISLAVSALFLEDAVPSLYDLGNPHFAHQVTFNLNKVFTFTCVPYIMLLSPRKPDVGNSFYYCFFVGSTPSAQDYSLLHV